MQPSELRLDEREQPLDCGRVADVGWHAVHPKRRRSSATHLSVGIGNDHANEHSAPVSQQMLVWISERMPRHAERVLAVARAKYARSAIAAG